MKKSIAVIFFVILAFIQQDCEAVSKIEKFILRNPQAFRLMGLGLCVGIGIVMLVYNYVTRKEEVREALLGALAEKKKTKEIKKEVASRMKEFKKIPKGPIQDVSLPPARLISLGAQERIYEVAPVRELTIGRSLENLLVVDRPSTSREHAKIRPQPEGYVLYDLLSRAGTYVNSQRITTHILHNGDVVGIGKESFLFKIGNADNG